MLQPLCGYVHRHRRAEARVRDLRDRLVVHQHGARPGRQLADALRPARRCSGFAEGLGEPGRDEGDVRVVSRRRARARRRLLQHRRVARLDAGGAARRVGDPDAQLAVRVRAHRRDRPRLGRALAAVLSLAREAHGAVAARNATTSSRARSRTSPATAQPVDRARSCGQRNFWGIAIPRFLADPTWGTLTFWLPLYLTTGARIRSEADRAVRLAAVPGGRSRLHVRRHDQHCAAEARRGPDQRAARRVHGRRAADDGRGVRRHGREPVRGHRAPEPRPASRTRRSRSPSSRWRPTCSSAARSRRSPGMAGTCGNAGVLVFSLLMGALVTHDRLHAVLHRPRACWICSARSCCGRSCASGGPTRIAAAA